MGQLRWDISVGAVIFCFAIVSELIDYPKMIRSEPTDIVGIIMNSVYLLCTLLMFIAFVQCHRLLYFFREKFPEVAAKEVPENGPPGRLLYFLRKEPTVLIQQDEKLRKIKRQIVVSFVVCVSLPLSIILCVVLGITFGWLNK